MKPIVILLLVLFSLPGVRGRAKPQKPLNIVLIYCDDLGYGDLSVNGALKYKTPNLDKMAQEGMRFTNFNSVQAVCSASRAGLMTGCYPNRVGISGALMPDSKIGLNPNEMTLAELLKQKNYATIAIGKWHLGHLPPFLPVKQGFDSYFGIPYSNDMWPVNYDGKPATKENAPGKLKYPPLPLLENENVLKTLNTLEDQSQLTTLYTEKAVDFIHKNHKKPFFIYLAHSMPHVPLAVSAKFAGKSEQGLYGDVIMEIDWSVGEIIRALETEGIARNTLIIFTSDNGPWLNFGNHAGNTGGLREGKGNSFEGGHRVPCIMKWPAQIPTGSVCNKLCATIDILPTLAEITHTTLPPRKIDGVSICALLKGDETADPRKTLLYYYRQNNLEAVRKGEWKLVFDHPGRTYTGFEPGKDGFPGNVNENFSFTKALYDLRRDPGERYDMKDYYPEIVTELEKIAAEAREDLGDELTKSAGKNRREPGRSGN